MRISSLKCGAWEARVAWDNAMNVFYLAKDGVEILRSPEDPEQLTKQAFVYGTPLLFPPSRTEGDCFTFNGSVYKLPYEPKAPGPDGRVRHNLHGKLYNAPMEIVKLNETTAVGEFASDESRYPFPFKLTVTAQLKEDGLYQSFAVTNIGSDPMPFALGLHNTFVERGEIKVSAGQTWSHGEGLIPKELIPLQPEQEKYLTGFVPYGHRLHDDLHDNGEHTACVGDTVFKLSSNFNEWVTWNMDGTKGFVSLEPQSGPVNALNMEGHYIVLQPGETEVFKTSITQSK